VGVKTLYDRPGNHPLSSLLWRLGRGWRPKPFHVRPPDKNPTTTKQDVALCAEKGLYPAGPQAPRGKKNLQGQIVFPGRRIPELPSALFLPEQTSQRAPLWVFTLQGLA